MSTQLMTRDAFNERLAEGLSGRVDGSVMVQEVKKLNDITKIGINIRLNNSTLAPIIYTEEYYDQYCDGRILEDIVEEIISIVKRHGDKKIINFDEAFISDYNRAKDYLEMKVINFDKNKNYLEDKPYAKFNNLAVVFYLNLGSDGESVKSIVVTKSLARMWDMDVNNLLVHALVNTPERQPYMIKSMKEMIADLYMGAFGGVERPTDMFPDDMDDDMGITGGMYVLTNKLGVNGASTILYPGVLKEISDKLESDLVILPSSIHEVIILKYNGLMDVDSLSTMVQEVNISEVSDTEVLADTPYLYSRETDKIKIM